MIRVIGPACAGRGSSWLPLLGRTHGDSSALLALPISRSPIDVRAEVFRNRAWNCRPFVRSLTDSPDAVIHSPAEIDAAWPTMAMRSRCPRDLAPRAQNPLSSLWTVTRSTEPAQHFPLRRLRFRLHPGIDCLPRGLREHFPMRFSRAFRCRSQGVPTLRTLGCEVRGLVSRLDDDCPHTVSGDSLHPADNARSFSGYTEHSTRLRQFLACG